MIEKIEKQQTLDLSDAPTKTASHLEEVWESKKTGLRVTVIKKDPDVIWWVMPEWRGCQQTARSCFEDEMTMLINPPATP